MNRCSLLPPPCSFGVGVPGLTGKEEQQLAWGEAGPVSTAPTLAVFSGPATQIGLALASTPSQAGPQEAANWPLDTLPLKLTSVIIGRLALFLMELPYQLSAWARYMQPLPPVQLFPEPEVRAEFRVGLSVCFHVCIHACACVACCHGLKDSEPLGSSLCRCDPGLYQVLIYVQGWGMDPGWVDSPVLRQYMCGGDMWLSRRNPRGKHCIRNWFSRLQRDLHFCF